MAIYLSESDRRVKMLSLEAQKKSPAKDKMSEASKDIEQAFGMPITLKDVGKWTKSIKCGRYQESQKSAKKA